MTSQSSTTGQLTDQDIQSHWERQSSLFSLPRAPAFTIALTRESGTRGTAVARVIGARLNWPVYDYELVELIAQKAGLRSSLLDSVDERRRHWLSEIIDQFTSSPGLSELGYTRRLAEVILSLGTLGHCVIVGRGAAQILPQKSTLRVRLVGLLSERIHSVSQQYSLSFTEAEHRVKERDAQRNSFVKSHFMKDPSEPTQCDLLLNRSRWSVTECADLIVQTLRFAEHWAASANIAHP